MKPDGMSDAAYRKLHIFIAKLERRRMYWRVVEQIVSEREGVAK